MLASGPEGHLPLSEHFLRSIKKQSDMLAYSLHSNSALFLGMRGVVFLNFKSVPVEVCLFAHH